MSTIVNLGAGHNLVRAQTAKMQPIKRNYSEISMEHTAHSWLIALKKTFRLEMKIYGKVNVF